MEIGVQISSLKPLLTTREQVAQAFAKVRALGCTAVQLQWIDPAVPVADIAQALAASGLRSVSVQDFFQHVQGDLPYYRDLNEVTGGTWLCVSRIPQACKSRQGLEEFARQLEALEAQVPGQRLCFHPVYDDYTALPGENAVDLLMERLPGLSLCLDLYHLGRYCPDMPGYLRRWAGRVPMVHFKDSRDGRLVPAGQGQTNWDGVVAACLETGVGYGFVEQETWEGDPYLCLKAAMTWLEAQIEQAGGKADGI